MVLYVRCSSVREKIKALTAGKHPEGEQKKNANDNENDIAHTRKAIKYSMKVLEYHAF